MHDDFDSYLDLKRKIQAALREQHAEWVKPDGDCPTCEEYSRRLDLLLKISGPAKTSSPEAPASKHEAIRGAIAFQPDQVAKNKNNP